jgi:deoxyribodipyrimidine photolyase
MFEENEWHCFFGCISVQEVWQDMEEKYMTKVGGSVTMIQAMIEELESRTMIKIAMVYGHFGGGETKNVGRYE